MHRDIFACFYAGLFHSLIDLRHVKIVKEIDEFLAAGRAIVLSRLLFQRLLQDLLRHRSSVVEVERDVGNLQVISHFLWPAMATLGKTANH